MDKGLALMTDPPLGLPKWSSLLTLSLVARSPSRCDKLVTNQCDKLVTSRCDKLVTNQCDKLVTSRCDKLVPADVTS